MPLLVSAWAIGQTSAASPHAEGDHAQGSAPGSPSAIATALKYGSLPAALEAAERGWSKKDAKTKLAVREGPDDRRASPEQLHRQQIRSLLESLRSQHVRIKLKDGRIIKGVLWGSDQHSFMLERTLRIGGQRVQVKNDHPIQSIIEIEHDE